MNAARNNELEAVADVTLKEDGDVMEIADSRRQSVTRNFEA